MASVHVLLVFGGSSAERRVSFTSAQAVYKALASLKPTMCVHPVAVSPSGRWFAGSAVEHLLCHAPAYSDIPESLPEADEVFLAPGRGFIVCGLAAHRPLKADVLFPLVHGPGGEDGTLQAVCQLAGIPCVGSGVAASAACFDKSIAKDIVRAHELPQVDYLKVSKRQWDQEPEHVTLLVEQQLGFPCFVKPSRMGSSIGISKCIGKNALSSAASSAFAYDHQLVIERSVEGAREVEVAILGNAEPRVSQPGEILPSADFYSYEDKYLASSSSLVTPADLPAHVAAAICKCAATVFQLMKCRGLARVDFFVDPGDTTTFWINEINTIPGFTPISMYPRLWLDEGLRFEQVVERLVHLALDWGPDEQREHDTAGGKTRPSSKSAAGESTVEAVTAPG